MVHSVFVLIVYWVPRVLVAIELWQNVKKYST